MIEFRNLTKKPVSTGKMRKLYNKIFLPAGQAGPRKFELSVVFAPPSLMKKLNIKYRGADKPANVLSFLIGKNQGEIFLNINEKNLPYLFLHGALHLLGHGHKNNKDAEKMEKLEKKILNR